MEEPFFFESGDNKLFGVTHAPAEPTRKCGLVLVHPFGEEKLWSHRVFVNFAREAASRGVSVLRFDLAGHGDSEGQSENCTIASYLADIDEAKNRFRSSFPDVERIGLLGLRLGATLAFLSASRSTDLSSLVLWEPIQNGAKHMQELLRINLSTQLAVYGSIKDNREALVEKMKTGAFTNVDGYLISLEFFEECSAIDLAHVDPKLISVPTIVTQIAPNIRQKDRQDIVDLAGNLPNGKFLKVEEPPFWREIKPFSSRANNLISATLDSMEYGHDR